MSQTPYSAEDAARTRQGASRLADQGRRLRERARATRDERMREMMEAQAALLLESAEELELKALALDPPAGRA